MKKIDLHIHSKFSSDGQLDVKAILDLSKEQNIKCISITDHNSVKAIDEAISYGRSIGVNVISGIELDCDFNGNNIHLLGYGFDYKDPIFEQIENDFSNSQILSLKEGIRIIKRTGGVPILAHPGVSLKNNYNAIYDLINEGIRGVEVFTSHHSDEDVEFFSKVAKEKNLVISCGSDFHGDKKPEISLGKFEHDINYDNIEYLVVKSLDY